MEITLTPQGGRPVTHTAPLNDTGSYTLTLDGLEPGDYTVHVNYPGDETFGQSSADTSFTVSQLPTPTPTQTTTTTPTRSPSGGGSGSRLPMTGSDATALALAGAGLLTAGLLAIRRRTSNHRH